MPEHHPDNERGPKAGVRVEFDVSASTAIVLPENAPSERSNAALEALRKQWHVDAWLPYERWLDHEGGPTRTETVTFHPLGAREPACTDTFSFDGEFFAQALEAYAAQGWAGLLQLQRLVAKHHAPATKAFVGRTLVVVATAVSDELWRLEKALIDHAKIEATRARDTAAGYLRKFTPIGKATNRRFAYELTDRKVADAVFAECAKFCTHLRRYRELEGKIKDRRKKEGSTNQEDFVRREYQLRWYELFAIPQREIWSEMSAIMARVKELFLPAVLVLDQLATDLDKKVDGWALYKLQRGLEGMIHDTIARVHRIASEQLVALAKPGLATHAAARCAELAQVKPGELLAEPGVEGAIIAAGLKADETANRVWMDEGLVRRVIDTLEPTWRLVVATRYEMALTTVLDEKRANEDDWNTFWGVATWFATMLGLIALLAIFPFGTGAAAPGLLAALSVVGSMAATLSIVVMLHDLVHLFAENEKAAAELRTSVFDLAQRSPRALYEVSRTFARCATLRRALTTDLLKTLITLAAARTFKPVALMLELEGFMIDVETLFHPPALVE